MSIDYSLETARPDLIEYRNATEACTLMMRITSRSNPAGLLLNRLQQGEMRLEQPSWAYTTLFTGHVLYAAKTPRISSLSAVADESIGVRRRCPFFKAIVRRVCGVCATSNMALVFLPLCHDLSSKARGHYQTICRDDRARALRLDSLQGQWPSRKQIRVNSCLLNLVAMMKVR